MQGHKTEGQTKSRVALGAMVSLMLIGQGFQAAGHAAPAATAAKSAPAPAKAAPASASLAAGKAKLTQGKVNEAVTILRQVAAKTPNDCECQLALGAALCKRAGTLKTSNKAAAGKDYIEARNALRRAIRLGKGGKNSIEANRILMSSVPAEYLKPRIGEGTEMIAAALGVAGRDRGSGDARPKVFEFYADWCEPCKKLKPVLETMKAEYGDKVDFVSYNVDDQRNAQFIDQYEVSPIPTIIYLSPDNQVVGYSIGFSGERSVAKELQKILPGSGS